MKGDDEKDEKEEDKRREQKDNRRRQTKMSTKMFNKENSFRLFLPKFNVSINTSCDDVIGG